MNRLSIKQLFYLIAAVIITLIALYSAGYYYVLNETAIQLKRMESIDHAHVTQSCGRHRE